MNTTVFSKLHPKIQQILKEKQILNPTEPQKKAVPEIIKGSHVLLIAPTGHGKTESALLPVFHEFLKQKEKNQAFSKEVGNSILYITPLRALNRDMLKRTISWGESLNISVAVRHGDTTQSERVKQSRKPPDMLITTPETFQILFVGKNLRSHIHKVRWVIIDEIHELAHDERGAQLAVALERLEQLTKQKSHSFQRIGLSATVGAPEEVARYLGGLCKENIFRPVKTVSIDAIKKIDLTVEMPKVEERDFVESARLTLDPRSFAALRRCKTLIDDHVSTLFFTNTRDGAEILSSRFHIWAPGYPIGVHHGSLSKHARIEAEDQFKSNELKTLICTSSLELGIDVGDTDFIIQYNSPREVTRIVQRIGRSGHRIGKTSKGVIISTTPEDLAESLVIARKTLARELEVSSVRKNPLSVLCNQIISTSLATGRIHEETLFQILKRSYPFSSLEEKRFHEIVDQLIRQRSIWYENGYLGKRRNSRNYFLDNISMIPDEKSFVAVDISSRKNVGKLDERFVLNMGVEGQRFILSGRPWKIIQMEEEKVLIAPDQELGEAPSWTGEDIPVPFDVAMEVGKLRRLIDHNQDLPDYPCNIETLDEIKNQIKNQKEKNLIVPSDKIFTLEVENRHLIINGCCGTKVNETIGRILSALLAQSIGESVGITNDAYRIHLELPYRMSAEKIKDLFFSTSADSLEYLLSTMLKNSTFIRWQLVHAARKFGALRKDFDYKNIGIKKLFTLFDHTPIFDEALDKLIWERMDILHAKYIFQQIQDGNITLVIQKLSPIGLAGMETIKGLMAPQRADRIILKALKNRIEETRITLACINCTKKWHVHIKNAPSHPICPKCDAIKIAALPQYRENEMDVLKKKKTTDADKKEIKRLYKNASLILSYGKPALITLMGRGIGPDTAARLLRRYDPVDLQRNKDTLYDLIKDIHKAEIKYAQTRGFWDA
ncbi:MAG: hypothetical protein DRN27_00915 [Thermoplasmata archaeon]|nr:MAG: hypothetical protein DRN27_00915 [Thermoplasmata archaeon]